MKSKLLAFAAISVLAVFSPTYSIADEATVTATPAAEAVDSDAVLHRASAWPRSAPRVSTH
jgi:hypothetical protein